jgi:hypothetical protein
MRNGGSWAEFGEHRGPAEHRQARRSLHSLLLPRTCLLPTSLHCTLQLRRLVLRRRLQEATRRSSSGVLEDRGADSAGVDLVGVASAGLVSVDFEDTSKQGGCSRVGFCASKRKWKFTKTPVSDCRIDGLLAPPPLILEAVHYYPRGNLKTANTFEAASPGENDLLKR